MTTVVFDVNETLLDLGALDEHFERIFGDVSVKEQWFSQVLHSALVATILNQTGDTNFGDVARAALYMMGLKHGVEVTGEDEHEVIGKMLTLPPHEDVLPALEALDKAGIRMSALTNSSQMAAVMQLTTAGLGGLMYKIMSVQSAGKFKPAIEVYQMAAKALDEKPEDLWLVAAHDWDVAGARNAGWNGAFVARPGKVLTPDAEEPEIVGSDMIEVAKMLIERIGSG